MSRLSVRFGSSDVRESCTHWEETVGDFSQLCSECDSVLTDNERSCDKEILVFKPPNAVF